MNENDMDSFLYLRDGGFDGDNQAGQVQNQEQQSISFMDDQRQSWPDQDSLNTLQDQHDVTHFLLPMETEEWSLLHQNQLLSDQAMFHDENSSHIVTAPEVGSETAGPDAHDETMPGANYVTPDMIYQQNNKADAEKELVAAVDHNPVNESSRMSTRSRTKKADTTSAEDGGKVEQDSIETAERNRRAQKHKKLYCICQQPYDGNPMVQCDNCQEWFHCSCVNLDPDEAVDVDWTCNSCPKVPGKIKKKDHNSRWHKEREASAEWTGTEDEDEELQEESKKAERKKSATPAKCLLSSCSKPARNDSLFCSEKCATDHVSTKIPTRRRSRHTQSPESQAGRHSEEKEIVEKRQSVSNVQIKNAENDAVRRNVIKSLTATLKTLIEAALAKDPTLFTNPDDDVSEGNVSDAQSPDMSKTSNNNDTEKAAATPSGTSDNEKKDMKPKSSTPSAMQIAEQLAANIENAMFEHLAEPHPKFPASKSQTCGERYKGKFRSLLYNLKDKANEIFQLRVITGDLAPEILVNMSGEDMANPELKSMSETLRQKSIKNSVLKIQNMPIIKKTHKGDIIMMPPQESNIYAEDQVAKKSPLIKLDDQKFEQESSQSPSSRKSSLSMTPKSPTINTDTLDDILARMGSSTAGKDNGKGKRSAEGTVDKEQKKRKMELDMEKLLGDEDVQFEFGSDDEGLITSGIKSYDNDIHLNDAEVSQYGTTTPSGSPNSQDQVKSYSHHPIWHGKTIMQQVAEFESVALQVGGRYLAQAEWTDILSPTIWIEGRIPTDRVTDYLTQTQFSSSKELILVEIKCSQPNGQQDADNLLKYFHSRQRYGVVARNKTTIKDFYIIPLAAQDHLPDCLVALNHKLTDHDRDRDMLLGIIVLNKKLVGDQRRASERHSRHGSNASTHGEQVIDNVQEQPVTGQIPEPAANATPDLSGILQGGELNPLLKQLLSNKDIVQLLNNNQTPNISQSTDVTYPSIPAPPSHNTYRPIQSASQYHPNMQQSPAFPNNMPPSATGPPPYNQYGKIPSGPASAYRPYQQNWKNPNPAYGPPDIPPVSNTPARQTRWDTPGVSDANKYSQYPTGPAAMYPPRDRGPPRAPEFNRGRGRGTFGHNNGRGRRGHPGDHGRPRRR